MVRNNAWGAVGTVITILATLAEFSYLPTNRNDTSHLSRRLLFILVTLALTAGPTFYIAVAANQPGGSGSLALILGIAQFFISIDATLLFRIMPSGRMFGDRIASKSRNYLASHSLGTRTRTRALLSPRSLAHSLALAPPPLPLHSPTHSHSHSHPPRTLLAPSSLPADSHSRALHSPCSLAHSLALAPSSPPAHLPTHSHSRPLLSPCSLAHSIALSSLPAHSHSRLPLPLLTRPLTRTLPPPLTRPITRTLPILSPRMSRKIVR
jgi:hypothetical protein